MHSNSQSQRPHHRERLIRKRRHYWNTAVEHKTLGKLAKTPTPCSCWICGNPRRHSGKPTLQEARHNQKAIEAMNDSGLQKIHNIGPRRPSY
jgi:hypothetical protein